MDTPEKTLKNCVSSLERSSIKASQGPHLSYLSKQKRETETSMSVNSFEMTELKDSLFGFTVNISDIDLCSFQSDSLEFGKSLFNKTEETIEEGNYNNLRPSEVKPATKQIVFTEPKNYTKIQPKELLEPSIEDPSFSIHEIHMRISKAHCSSLCMGYLLTPIIEYSDTSIRKTAENFYVNNIARTITPRQSFTYLTCGFEHCLALTSNGKVMAWGNGQSGCLGIGSLANSNVPVLVHALLNKVITHVEAGAFHNAVVSSEGNVYTWGRGDVHQLGIPCKHLLRDKNGYVSLAPTKLSYFSNIVGVACGEAHTLVVNMEGMVFAFGWAEDGQLGIPSNELISNRMSSSVHLIGALAGHKIVKVSAGALFSACLSEDGEVFVWGNGEHGQLGRGKNVLFEDFPRSVTLSDKIANIVCGESSVLCISQNGTLYGWGLGIAGNFEGESIFGLGSELACFLPQVLIELNNFIKC